MKNGFFIVDQTVFVNENASGTLKKVVSQIKAMNIDNLMRCSLVEFPSLRGNPIKLFCYCFFVNLYKNVSIDFSSADFIYIRAILPVNYGFIEFIKKCKIINPDCKIILELPTYPYEKEARKIKSKMGMLVDKIFRVKLKKYIDKIVTFSNDNIILGISTIKIVNGIDCNMITLQKPIDEKTGFHFIAVAKFNFWHGYDRLIEGLYNYYKGKSPVKVFIHFVGSGKGVKKYINISHIRDLDDYIIFHGLLYGDALDAVFNFADIAVCSLGGHRKGLYLSSELKSREYLARGIPIISSIKIDIIPKDYQYCFYIEENDNPIDIMKVIEFHRNILINKSRSQMISEISSFAKENCDISKTMMPIIEYLTA
jgi:hypothetical protein